MIWKDLYNSLPIENLSMLMMAIDDEGNKYYSLASCRDSEIYHQQKDGSVGQFDIDSVFGREHIYYIYTDDIKLPRNALETVSICPN